MISLEHPFAGRSIILQIASRSPQSGKENPPHRGALRPPSLRGTLPDMPIRTLLIKDSPPFRSPVFSLLLFTLSGAGFGLLFGRRGLAIPDFWIIFLLLLPFFLLRPSGRLRGFFEGMAFGLAANILGIRWLLVTMQDYGHLSLLLAFGGLLLFSLYLSLFPAFFRWGTLVLSLWEKNGGGLSLRAVLLAPALWILSEAGRTEILTGFPWNPLGSLLFGHPALELPARILGTTGLSFLIVTGSVLLALFWEGTARFLKSGDKKRVFAGRITLLATFFLLWPLAGHRLERIAGKGPVDLLPVALVQGNIPPDQKWSADHLKADLAIYRNLSQRGIAQGARLLLWPETALPIFYTSAHPVLSRDLSTLLSPHTFLVTGSIGETPDPSQPMGIAFTNAAVLFGPDGKVRSDYIKQHLVPFGEFLPLPEIFGWLRPLIGVAGDMARGDHPGLFPLPNGLSLSPLICYEALYPSLVRKNLGPSQILGVISDDAWFGDTSAPYQLFRESAMRALENGVPMLRAANTGLSGAVLPDGTISLRGPLFEEALLEGKIPVPRPDPKERTFYRQHGEWLLKLSLLGLLFFGAIGPLREGKKSGPPEDGPPFR